MVVVVVRLRGTLRGGFAFETVETDERELGYPLEEEEEAFEDFEVLDEVLGRFPMLCKSYQ
jgi:hypothetical protein